MFERPTFKQCYTAIITGLRNLQDQRSQRFSANELPRWFVRNLARSYDAATLNSWQDDFRVVVIQRLVEKVSWPPNSRSCKTHSMRETRLSALSTFCIVVDVRLGSIYACSHRQLLAESGPKPTAAKNQKPEKSGGLFHNVRI